MWLLPLTGNLCFFPCINEGLHGGGERKHRCDANNAHRTPREAGNTGERFYRADGPLHPAGALNWLEMGRQTEARPGGRGCSRRSCRSGLCSCQFSPRARAFAECPSGSERLEQAGRCSTSSRQACRRGNGTRPGGSGWSKKARCSALLPPLFCSPAR